MYRGLPFFAVMVLCPALPVAASGIFMDGDRLLLQTSVWTTHYNPEPDHHERQDLINLEWLAPDSYRFGWQKGGALGDRAGWLSDVNWLAGAASFRNSFDQRSIYVYGGGRYDLVTTRRTRVYSKLTVGLMHGYRGQYRDKIPFNSMGVAPVILPALGIEHRRVNLEMIPFGTAGVMFNVGFYLN